MANSITIDLKGNDAHLKAVSTRVQASMRKLQVSFQRVALAAKIMLLGIGAGIGFALKSAAEAEAAAGKFDAVFRESAKSVTEWADVFAKQVGRSSLSIRIAASQFQSLLEPMGFTNKEAAEMSTRFTKLAIDIASFEGKLDVDVVTDLLSALSGSSETVVKYGADIKQAAVNQELLNTGIEGGTKSANRNQIATAKLNILLRDTITALDDAADTLDESGNKWKEFMGILEDVSVIIGETFMPIAKDLLETVAGIAKFFSVWAKSNKELVITFVKWGAGIGVAILAINAMIKVIALLNIQLWKTVAAKIAVLAMSGPTGLLQLGAGLLAIAGAGLFVEEQFRRIKQSVDKAKKSITESNDESKKGLEDANKAREKGLTDIVGGGGDVVGKSSQEKLLQQRIREDRAFRGIKDPLAGVSNPILRDQIIKEQNRAIQAQQALDKNNKLLGDIHLTLKSPSPVALGAFGK